MTGLTPDDAETVQLVWLEPQDALDAVASGAISMAPPQWWVIPLLGLVGYFCLWCNLGGCEHSFNCPLPQRDPFFTYPLVLLHEISPERLHFLLAYGPSPRCADEDTASWVSLLTRFTPP